MADFRFMNTSESSNGGWAGSNMRTVFLPGIFDLLPPDLQGVIKPVFKYTATSSSSSSLAFSSTDTLFLLSEAELLGSTVDSISGEGSLYEYYQGKTQYDYTKRIDNGSGSTIVWWLRSASVSYNTSFCRVSPIGRLTYGSANGSAGVSFCFCV
jgi:hypothetical protein